MLLHTAAKSLGIDEAQRRVIQANVGGFYSAADKTASREGFAAVMAFYEARSDGKLDGFSEGYWRGAVAKNQSGDGTDRLIWRIRREAEALRWSDADVDAFLAGGHMSAGKAARVADASGYWLGRLLEALKQMNRRRCVG